MKLGHKIWFERPKNNNSDYQMTSNDKSLKILDIKKNMPSF